MKTEMAVVCAELYLNLTNLEASCEARSLNLCPASIDVLVAITTGNQITNTS